MGIQEVIYLLAGLGVGALVMSLIGGKYKKIDRPEANIPFIDYLTKEIDKRRTKLDKEKRDEKSVEDYHNNPDNK